MTQYEAMRHAGAPTPSPTTSPRPDVRHWESSQSTLDNPARYQAIYDADETTTAQNDRKSGPFHPEMALVPSDEPDATPSGSTPSRRSQSHHWWHRIGSLGLLMLGAGTVVILASCALLIFLWRGAEAARDRNEPEFWRTIVFQGWSTRLVTICSAAIRVSIDFQIGLLAAAMASVILETSGTRFLDTATLSIQRAVGSGPFAIFPAALGQLSIGGLLGPMYFVIIAAAAIIALASTFTSTILLSDFGTSLIAAQNTTKTMGIGLDAERNSLYNGASYWRSRPLAHSRFAEVKIGEPHSATGITDTGDTYRAMLPFATEQSRTSLEYYAGPAIVTNFRTACVAPGLGNLDLDAVEAPLDKDQRRNGLYLEGKVKAKIDDFDELEDKFRCKVHDNWNETSLQTWPLMLCNGLSSTQWASDGPRDPLNGAPYTITSLLLINSSAPLNGVVGLTNLPLEFDKLTTKKDGPWTKVLASNGTQILSASVCFVAQNQPLAYNITMSGQSISSEPIVDWRRSNSMENSRRLRQQLGVGVPNQDFDTRGILELDIHRHPNYSVSADTSGDRDLHALPGSEEVLEGVLGETTAVGGWSLSDRDNTAPDSPWTAHATHISIFQDIIQASKDPATALQALTFQFYKMIYYDQLPSFNMLQQVTTVNSTEVLIPVQQTGLGLVLGLVGAHFVLVIVTIVLYALRTKVSSLDNAWQAVSQMVSSETKEIIDTGSEMRDKDVKAWAKSTGLDVGVYGISRSAESEGTEIYIH